jgi:hypothetical protein
MDISARFLCGLVSAVAALSLLSGCGEKTGKLSSAELKSFDSAAPEMKQIWTTALEVSKTNDYFGGQTLFSKLLTGELTPEQRSAVSKASTELNARLYAAFEKGDPEAQKAIQELRSNPPNRPR